MPRDSQGSLSVPLSSPSIGGETAPRCRNRERWAAAAEMLNKGRAERNFTQALGGGWWGHTHLGRIIAQEYLEGRCGGVHSRFKMGDRKRLVPFPRRFHVPGWWRCEETGRFIWSVLLVYSLLSQRCKGRRNFRLEGG